MGRLGLAMAAASIVLAGCGGGGGGGSTAAAVAPEVLLGQRLFRETRFAEFFATNCGGNVNVNPPPLDPVLAVTVSSVGNIPGPVAGPTMSCRACHLHEETVGMIAVTRGLRTFGDFARRSPIPTRADGLLTTPRNSPPLVGVAQPGTGPFVLHFDGEFANGVDLVREAILGRNYGWFLSERAAAKAHVARVIREDDGTGPLAAQTGGLSYAALLRGDPGVSPALLIPPALRIDPVTASEDQILDAIGALVDAFLKSLDFRRDAGGDFAAAPYDLFLLQNGLPRRPLPGESDVDYLRRLRSAVAALQAPVFVTALQGTLDLEPFGLRFEQPELEGLRIFLAEPASSPPSPAEIAAGGIGNCLVCHSGPRFSDFLPHNVGAAQEEYDAIFGSGAFLALAIPDLATRSANPDQYLPSTLLHPAGQATFRSVPDVSHPGFTDLGAWNILANPDFPAPQAALAEMLRSVNGLPPGTTPDVLLPFAIASFKTPSLRSTGLSGPYFHTGRLDLLETITQHYLSFGEMARAGLVRNPDPKLRDIALVPANLTPMAAFMRSLTEDFE